MKLSIVGLGISGTDHLTQQAIKALKTVDEVLYPPNPAKDIDRILDALGITRSVDLLHLYGNGEIDNINYERIYDRVLDACKSSQHVGSLFPGKVGNASWHSVSDMEGAWLRRNISFDFFLRDGRDRADD